MKNGSAFLDEFPIEVSGPELLDFLADDVANGRTTSDKLEPALGRFLGTDATAQQATSLATKYLESVSIEGLPAVLGLSDCNPAEGEHYDDCGPSVVLPAVTEQLFVSAFRPI